MVLVAICGDPVATADDVAMGTADRGSITLRFRDLTPVVSLTQQPPREEVAPKERRKVTPIEEEDGQQAAPKQRAPPIEEEGRQQHPNEKPAADQQVASALELRKALRALGMLRYSDALMRGGLSSCADVRAAGARGVVGADARRIVARCGGAERGGDGMGPITGPGDRPSQIQGDDDSVASQPSPGTGAHRLSPLLRPVGLQRLERSLRLGGVRSAADVRREGVGGLMLLGLRRGQAVILVDVARAARAAGGDDGAPVGASALFAFVPRCDTELSLSCSDLSLSPRGGAESAARVWAACAHAGSHAWVC
eukprot:gene41848-63955_t